MIKTSINKDFDKERNDKDFDKEVVHNDEPVSGTIHSCGLPI